MTQELGFNGELTIAIQAKDRKAAVKWYREVLGFELLYEIEEMEWCEMTSPVTKVSVGIAQAEKPKVGAGPVPTWGVSDIDAVRRTLEEKDVRFDGDTTVIPGMVKLATFYDPDGNAWMLAQGLQSS